MKKTLAVIITLISLLSLSSCDLFKTKNVVNNVTNNITTTVVDYENLSVKDLQTAVENVCDKVEDAVIGLTLKKKVIIQLGFDKIEEYQDYAYGSAVIYKREEIIENENLVNYKYYCITNRHVVLGDEGEYELYAYLGNDDVEIKATINGYDKKFDIALVTFNYSKYIQPVDVADSTKITKGSFAIAIGNPEGYNYYNSATLGIISSDELRYVSTDTDSDGTDDFYAEYIQHDVAINPGNSGGGLFNIYGQLIGINTMKLVDDEIENMGFSIPSNIALNLVSNYFETGVEIVRPTLGIQVIETRNMTESIIKKNNLNYLPDIYGDSLPYGVYITNVNSGTINSSNITKDDIILKFDGVKITRMYVLSSLLNSLLEYKVGDSVEIEYYSASSKSILTTTVLLQG